MKNNETDSHDRRLSNDQVVALLKNSNVSASDADFSQQIFQAISREMKRNFYKKAGAIERICSEEYTHLSQYLDVSKVQEGCSVRNVLKTRQMAALLIDEEGKIDESSLVEMIAMHQKHFFSLGPDRQHDSWRQEHILRALQLLKKDESVRKQLMAISRPSSHKHAEKIIRATLLIGDKVSVTDAHARRAALSAWMCALRQSVGSCFGTAPAILVQQEQPGLFLKDIMELLSKGSLTRIRDGVEYSVPLSHSWGSGDLKKPLIISEDMFREGAEFDEKIWWSPGLLTALKKVGVVSETESIQERRKSLKNLIYKVLGKVRKHGELYITTCEELLRLLLIDHHQLTERAIQDYENRPRNIITSPFIVQQTSVSSGKRGSVGTCVSQIQEAMNEFVALADNALLKAWEFSIASFAETKAKFTRWNLYSSLGFGPEEPNGIGQCLHQIVQQRLDEANRAVEKLQSEYEQVYLQVQMLGNRLKRAKSKEDARWVKTDYQSKLNEFESLEEMRNKEHARAQRLAGMFQLMIKRYYDLFPEYFQEVYDADMHLALGQYDDSPAGFHLLYKHGRKNTSQWTPIHNSNEYVESLVAFFTATENTLTDDEELTGLKEDVTQAVTAIVGHVRTQEFLESSFHRMAIAHNIAPIRNPLENLDKIEKKPWAYTSGGNVETLINGYFGRSSDLATDERWVENEMELFVFTVDTLKRVPHGNMEKFLEFPNKSFLMHSPTHVFLLKPNIPLFRKTWENDAYTYIWVRDHFKQPMDQFLLETKLTAEMMDAAINDLAKLLHADTQPQFKQVFRRFPREMRPPEFREYVLQNFSSRQAGAQYKKSLRPEEIDGFLFSRLPYFPHYEMKDRIKRILESMDELSEETASFALELFEKHLSRRPGAYMVDAKRLVDCTLSLICLSLGKTTSVYNYHKRVLETARKLGYAYPEPAIFADTNWVKNMFAFLVNPGTGKFEFWCVDVLGSEGFPMNTWKSWLDGSRKKPTWGIFSNPFEYNMLV